MADDPKTKIKKIVKDIIKADNSIITDAMTYSQVIEVIGRLQNPKFKYKELKK